MPRWNFFVKVNLRFGGRTNASGRVFVLANRIVLITGGTRGIGFALSRAFLSSGDQVVITSKTAESIEQAEAALVQYKISFGRSAVMSATARTANSWLKTLSRNLAESIF